MMVLIDGDVIAYRAAYSAEGEQLEVAVEKADELLDNIIFDTTKRGEGVEVYLTGKGNFRYTISPSYKANRKDTPKPEHLSDVRNYLIKEWDAVVSQGEEADDLIAIKAASLGYDCTIVSTDKDFKQLPCLLYNPNKGEWNVVGEFEAITFFYSQILMGDRADNIEGIYGIGPVKAKKILADCKTEEELYAKVLSMYDNDEEKVLQTARLLWLRRKEEELWLPPGQR